MSLWMFMRFHGTAAAEAATRSPRPEVFPLYERCDESSDASIVRARSDCSSHKSYEPERHIGWYVCIVWVRQIHARMQLTNMKSTGSSNKSSIEIAKVLIRNH
jgi:hypothetical protein